MSIQLSVTARNQRLAVLATLLANGATLKVFSGAMPANCAAADSGTQLASPTLPNSPFNAPANGVMTLAGNWEDTSADAAGTAGYFRLYDTGGVCHTQGTVTTQVAIPANAASPANADTIQFASTNGVVVGMNASGTNIPANTTVLAVTSTVVTLSSALPQGIANGASIVFAGDMTVDNAIFAAGQDFKVTSFTLTDANA